jgi:hypothetical protein
MIILKVNEKGHTVTISGHIFRTPATVDITHLNERMIKVELQKHGINKYSIESIPDEQIKKNPKLIQMLNKKESEKKENIQPTTEQIENRLLSIENLLKQILNKPEPERVVYIEKSGEIQKQISKEKRIIEEEDVGFIPSVDTEIKIKGSEIISKVEKGKMDLDEKSKSLSKFLKK